MEGVSPAICWQPRVKIAYEVKVTKTKTLYLYGEDVKPLIEFCRNFGFQAYVAVRWKYARKHPWTFKQIFEAEPLKIVKEH